MTAEAGKKPTPRIRMKQIRKRFGATLALDEVSIDVSSASIHALVGENGAGKSTLMKILAGAYRPDAGEVLLDGRPLHLRTPADALRAGIAMVYQELSLAPHLSVAENVVLGQEPRSRFGIDRTAARRAVRELARQSGLELDPDRPVASLSTAMRQHVEILRALARDASVLILDEPTSSLPERDADALMSVLRRLRDRGLAILYISHRLEEVERLADSVTILRDGRRVYSGPADQGRDRMIRHMVGREMTELYPPRERGKPGEAVLQVQSLSGPGFRDVSLSLRAGEVLGMAGLVGAGRSELAAVLAGVEPPAAGRILCDGRECRLHPPGKAIAEGIGFLTEDRRNTGLFPHLSVAANMTIAALDRFSVLGRIRTRSEHREAEQQTRRLDIKSSGTDALITGLSGGNQQKVLLARWLLTEARVLLLDEPTRGIDVGAKYDIYRLIDSLAARGLAILMVSSELPELFGVTDRIAVLCRGRLSAVLDTAATTPDEVMHCAVEPDPGQAVAHADGAPTPSS